MFPPLLVAPSFACSVASLSQSPGHQLSGCRSLHRGILTYYQLGWSKPSTWFARHADTPSHSTTFIPQGNRRMDTPSEKYVVCMSLRPPKVFVPLLFRIAHVIKFHLTKKIFNAGKPHSAKRNVHMYNKVSYQQCKRQLMNHLPCHLSCPISVEALGSGYFLELTQTVPPSREQSSARPAILHFFFISLFVRGKSAQVFRKMVYTSRFVRVILAQGPC